MAKWTVRSQSQSARNGTTTATFTMTQPTAGSFLTAIFSGAVTFTAPTGWTLERSAVNNGGLYLFTKASAAGTETTITSTMNGSDYATGAVFYEFPSGSTIAGSLGKTAAGSSAFSGAALTGLTSSAKLLVGVGSQVNNAASAISWSAWSNSAVEDTDVFAQRSVTDGYGLGIAYLEDSVLTGWTPTATITGTTVSAEAITFAVNVAGGGAAPATPPIIVLAPRR